MEPSPFKRNAALFNACYENDIETVKSLNDNGEDVSSRDKESNTPLHIATDVNLLEYLISKGENVNATNCSRFTPLFVACMHNDFEKCKFLIEHGADVNVVSHKQKRAAIHIASSLNNVKIFELLVANGANVLAEDKKGRTAFQIAKNQGFFQIANFYSHCC
jgi:ankyrin repeat protein